MRERVSAARSTLSYGTSCLGRGKGRFWTDFEWFLGFREKGEAGCRSGGSGGAGRRAVAGYFLGIVFPESGLIWGCYGVVLGKQCETIERKRGTKGI